MLGAVFVLFFIALSAGIVSLVGSLFGFVPAMVVGVGLAVFLFTLVKGGITRMNAPRRPAAPAEPTQAPAE